MNIPDPGRASKAVELIVASPMKADRYIYEHQPIRTVVIDSEPWFVASDVANVLEYRMASDMTRRLEDCDKGYAKVSTPGGGQDMTVINESGLYDAVFRSNSEGAKPFRRWVTGEVIPAIRRTGSYATTTEPTTPALPQTYAEALRAAADQAERAELAESKVAELEPKAEFYDDLMESDGTYSFLAISKMLGWGRNVMMRELRRSGVIQGNNLPYQRYEHHFKVTPGTYINRKTGQTIPTATTTVRPSGIDFLRKKLDRSPVVTA